jgi:hypothetical protein
MLQDQSLGKGERSLSNFVRTTLLQQSKAGPANLGDDLASISARLWDLNRLLSELSSCIERLLRIGERVSVEQDESSCDPNLMKGWNSEAQEQSSR